MDLIFFRTSMLVNLLLARLSERIDVIFLRGSKSFIWLFYKFSLLMHIIFERPSIFSSLLNEISS